MKQAACTSIVINFALDSKASLAPLCIGANEFGAGYSQPDKKRIVRREKPGFEVAIQRSSAHEARMKISRTSGEPWEFADSLFAVNDAMHDLVQAGLVRNLPCDNGFGSRSPVEDQLQCTDIMLNFENVDEQVDLHKTPLRLEGFPVEDSRFAPTEAKAEPSRLALKIQITPDLASSTWVDIRAGIGATYRILADRELHRSVDDDIAFVRERETVLERELPQRIMQGGEPEELALQL